MAEEPKPVNIFVVEELKLRDTPKKEKKDGEDEKEEGKPRGN